MPQSAKKLLFVQNEQTPSEVTQLVVSNNGAVNDGTTTSVIEDGTRDRFRIVKSELKQDFFQEDASSMILKARGFVKVAAAEPSTSVSSRIVPITVDLQIIVEPSDMPSSYPSIHPTLPPSASPTFTPSEQPTQLPTDGPTQVSWFLSSSALCFIHTSVRMRFIVITNMMLQNPTNGPTRIPSRSPTKLPSDVPTAVRLELHGVYVLFFAFEFAQIIVCVIDRMIKEPTDTSTLGPTKVSWLLSLQPRVSFIPVL